MAGRRTNLALLGLLPLAVLSGFAAFAVGSGPVSLVVITHLVIGLAVLLLVPWKSMIVRRGLRRPRPGQLTSIVLAVAVVLTLLTGLAHSTGLVRSVGGVGTLLLHVGGGLVAVIPAALHVRRRRIRPRTTDLTRRSALRGGLLGVAAGGAYLAVEGATRAFDLPGEARRETGSYELSSGDPAGVPATSWLFDRVPTIDPAAYRLTVVAGGATRTFTLDELRSGDAVETVLDCTGGWWSRQTWTGTWVAHVLPAGSSGTVQVTSVTGYRRRFPLTDPLLLAVDAAGTALLPGHGAPVRLVAPGRRGFHWVKWVDRIEVDDRPWWWQLPFPAQ